MLVVSGGPSMTYEGYPESKDSTRVEGEEKSLQTIPLTAQTSLPAISICFCI
jgi:hypothetical protein